MTAAQLWLFRLKNASIAIMVHLPSRSCPAIPCLKVEARGLNEEQPASRLVDATTRTRTVWISEQRGLNFRVDSV